MKKELTQQEIDACFDGKATAPEDVSITPCDFSRLDRIPKSQLRAIHLLHEEFARALSSSLSVYLRAFVRMSLVSLEQIPYSEFLSGITSPTCIAYTNVAPYDATGMIEISPSIVAALIEVLLGGAGTTPPVNGRKMTEIEKGLIGAVLKIVLNDLGEAWRSVADVRFTMQSLSVEPEMFHAFAPMEGVIAISIDVVIGQTSGLMSLAIPSLLVKRLRRNLEHVRELSRMQTSGREQGRLKALLQDVLLRMEVVLDGGQIDARTLLDLTVGEVIVFSKCPTTQEPTAVINQVLRLPGEVVQTDGQLLFHVGEGNRKYKSGKTEVKGSS